LLIEIALILRPTGLGSGIDKERQDYTVYTGGWDIGRIYETRGGPEHLRWFWSFAVQVRRRARIAARVLRKPRPSFTLAGKRGRRGEAVRDRKPHDESVLPSKARRWIS
jgi:hypothetical protein